MEAKTIGLTKDVGWQFGVRKTFPITAHVAWDFLMSEEGMSLWLGKMAALRWEKGELFKTSAGVEGVVRVVKPDSHLRILWKKKGWENFSLVQVRVLKGIGKCVVSFHQEKLKNESQREEMKAYWESVMKKIETTITSLSP